MLTAIVNLSLIPYALFISCIKCNIEIQAYCIHEPAASNKRNHLGVGSELDSLRETYSTRSPDLCFLGLLL